MEKAQAHLQKKTAARVKVNNLIEEKKQSLNDAEDGEPSEEEAHEDAD